MREFFKTINMFYVSNIALVGAIACSIIFMFYVQFKVEALQDKLQQTEESIAAYKEDVKLLEVEWVYLTRPERLRNLANIYLKDNSYALASQIKDTQKLSKYYMASYREAQLKDVALN